MSERKGLKGIKIKLQPFPLNICNLPKKDFSIYKYDKQKDFKMILINQF